MLVKPACRMQILINEGHTAWNWSSHSDQRLFKKDCRILWIPHLMCLHLITRRALRVKKADMPKFQQGARSEIKDPAVLTLNCRQLPASCINVYCHTDMLHRVSKNPPQYPPILLTPCYSKGGRKTGFQEYLSANLDLRKEYEYYLTGTWHNEHRPQKKSQ